MNVSFNVSILVIDWFPIL